MGHDVVVAGRHASGDIYYQTSDNRVGEVGRGICWSNIDRLLFNDADEMLIRTTEDYTGQENQLQRLDVDNSWSTIGDSVTNVALVNDDIYVEKHGITFVLDGSELVLASVFEATRELDRLNSNIQADFRSYIVSRYWATNLLEQCKLLLAEAQPIAEELQKTSDAYASSAVDKFLDLKDMIKGYS